MSSQSKDFSQREYKYGFVTEIETDILPKGLSKDIVMAISKKKNEPKFMLDFRLKAYEMWLQMSEPTWANIHYDPIDYQGIRYYSAPKTKTKLDSLAAVTVTGVIGSNPL